MGSRIRELIDRVIDKIRSLAPAQIQVAVPIPIASGARPRR
jgi:hypothetical protein